MSLKRYTEQPEIVYDSKDDPSRDMQKLIKIIEDKYTIKINDFWDIHKWSVDNQPEFWAEVWDYTQVIHSKPFNKVIDRNAKVEDLPVWFEGALLNYAENVLKYRDDQVALIVTGEDRKPENITYRKLYEEACIYGEALKAFGVKKGDCIAAYMSNREEPVFAMLGTTSIGAMWTGALPLLGAQAALNRFKLIKPKILFTMDRFKNDGEEIEMLEKIKEIANDLPCLEKVVIVPSTPESKFKDISGIRNSCFLEEFLKIGSSANGLPQPLHFEQLPFNHPVFISYTSGTTGPPKALIHGFGIVLTMARDFMFHSGATRDTVYLSMSAVGWATWNIFATMLANGIKTVLFEGSPYYLSPTSLWDLVDDLGITNLFLTPSIIDELEKRNYVPSTKNHLRSLSMIFSGASVVKHQNYDFVYKKIKSNVQFGSYYGSTEIMGSLILIDSMLPVYKGEISVPSLGNVIECFNDSGESVTGEIGELVLRSPMPSLPLGLWGDENGEKFKELYCSKFPGTFCPGDLCLINPVTKGFIMYGRSDDTMKPKGARFGCVEIYNVVDTLEEVFESLCVSQYNKDRDERAVLFIKVKQGYQFDDKLVQKVRCAIEKELTKRHVPEVILEVQEIPRNMNGKKMEIVVKKIINRMPYNQETIKNPECLEYFKDVPQLRSF